jgi:hypothetical protein
MKVWVNGFSVSSEEEMKQKGIEKIQVHKKREQQSNGWMSQYSKTSYYVYCQGQIFDFQYYQHFFGSSITFPRQEVEFLGDEEALAEIIKEGKLEIEVKDPA